MSSVPDSRTKTLPMADTAAATDPRSILDKYEAADRPYDPVGIPEINHWARYTGPAQLGLTLRAVLKEIALYANAEGYAHPSQDTIAARLECSRATVNRAVMALEAFGLLRIEKVARENDQPYNRYRLAGVDTGWIPEPMDPEEKPTMLGVVRAVNKVKDRQMAQLADMVIRMSRGERINVTESHVAPFVVVVSTDQDTDKDNTTTTTLSVTLRDVALSNVTESYIAPSQEEAVDPKHATVDEEYERRKAEVTEWVEANMDSISFEKIAPAIRYFVENYDSAPKGSLSFLEQRVAIGKEKELKNRPKPTRVEPDRQKYLDAYRQRWGVTPDEENDGTFYVAEGEGSPEAAKLWRAVLGELEPQLPRSAFQTWLKDTKGHSIDDETFVVVAPTTFAVAWLQRRMYNAIQKTIEKVTTKPLEVFFAVQPVNDTPAQGD